MKGRTDFVKTIAPILVPSAAHVNHMLAPCRFPRGRGVVNFVSDRVQSTSTSVVRPQASSPRVNLPPHEETGEESDDASSSRSSVSARGVALSLHTSSLEGESKDEDEEDGNDIDPNPVSDPGYAAGKEDHDEDDGDEDMAPDDDDVELSSILESLTENVHETDPEDVDVADERPIGVIQDRVDLITIPKTKRVLSFNTLTALNNDVECIRDSPKRLKNTVSIGFGSQGLVGLSLGPPALSDSSELPKSMLQFRKRESPLISSSDDEAEALDRRLGEELEDELVRQQGQQERSQSNSPVPLLTPPDSPLAIEIDGDRATICEWPSNLAGKFANCLSLSSICFA